MKNENSITVAALTGGLDTPSSRFRIRQYIHYLKAHGVNVDEYIPYFEKSCGLPSPFKAAARIPALFKTRNADIIWVGKELVKGYLTFESFLKHPRVMDVDDAIWLSKPFGKLAAPAIAKRMDAVIAGNTFLADYFSKYCKKIHIIPTAIDIQRFSISADIEKTQEKKFIIGWTGLARNYLYLNEIEPILDAFIRDHDDAEILIISNRPWYFKILPPEKVTFIQWSNDNEVSTLHSMSVGIMPLTDDPWSRGKCSFKMLQYMAVGLPVIASPVGMNADIFKKGNIGFAVSTPDQWYNALESLYNDRTLHTTLGKTGRYIVEQSYNAETISKELAKIFKDLANA
jgi:glycosyltransferase involved in cell wall biosynthesis